MYWYTNLFLNITHNQNQKNNNYFLTISSNKKIINIKKMKSFLSRNIFFEDVAKNIIKNIKEKKMLTQNEVL